MHILFSVPTVWDFSDCQCKLFRGCANKNLKREDDSLHSINMVQEVQDTMPFIISEYDNCMVHKYHLTNNDILLRSCVSALVVLANAAT